MKAFSVCDVQFVGGSAGDRSGRTPQNCVVESGGIHRERGGLCLLAVPLLNDRDGEDIPRVAFKAGKNPFAVLALRRRGQQTAAVLADENLVYGHRCCG